MSVSSLEAGVGAEVEDGAGKGRGILIKPPPRISSAWLIKTLVLTPSTSSRLDDEEEVFEDDQDATAAEGEEEEDEGDEEGEQRAKAWILRKPPSSSTSLIKVPLLWCRGAE